MAVAHEVQTTRGTASVHVTQLLNYPIRLLKPLFIAQEQKPNQPPRYLWWYVIFISAVSIYILFTLFSKIPQVSESKNRSFSVVETARLVDKNEEEKKEKERFEAIRDLFVMTMGMTLCCGALGGCLFDMRGLIQHSTHGGKNGYGDFHESYISSYIIRPFAGAVSGFIVFLVLVGGLFSMELQPPNNNTGEIDWIILRRQLPFMAFATLSGYASHVFMMKLKDVSEVIFSIPGRDKDKTGPGNDKSSSDNDKTN